MTGVQTCALPILGNVTSVVEYSKIATVQQLGDMTMHIIQIFLREWGIAGGGVREVESGKRENGEMKNSE